MMTPIWPATLPKCPLRGFDETPRMQKVSFQSSTGPDIERPKGTMRMAEIPVTLRMKREQIPLFQDFVFDTLGQASLPFYTVHPRTHTQVKCKLTGDPVYRISQVNQQTYNVDFTLLVIG